MVCSGPAGYRRLFSAVTLLGNGMTTISDDLSILRDITTKMLLTVLWFHVPVAAWQVMFAGGSSAARVAAEGAGPSQFVTGFIIAGALTLILGGS